MVVLISYNLEPDVFFWLTNNFTANKDIWGVTLSSFSISFFLESMDVATLFINIPNMQLIPPDSSCNNSLFILINMSYKFTQVVKLLHIPCRMVYFGQNQVRASKLSSRASAANLCMSSTGWGYVFPTRTAMVNRASNHSVIPTQSCTTKWKTSES